jgi:phosphatidylglycerol:prolipoprotein diacylglycerol transferase
LDRLRVAPLTGVITIRLDPYIHLGPLRLAWHGLTIAVGILAGALVAGRYARERGLAPDPLWIIAALLALGGLVGGKVLYLLEHNPGGLVRPGAVFGGYGFTFDGGVVVAAALIIAYVWRGRRDLGYLDVVACALPFGVAIGRIGDVINGEHYGPRSNFFLAVRNANPKASTPNPADAYHNGGLYEVLLAGAIFALIWPLRHHFRRNLDLMWLVFALWSVGRFAMFFYRSDSPQLALGLNNAQWSSIGLLIVIAIGWPLAIRHSQRARPAGAP